MPDGYLVQLGDGVLGPGDGIVDPLVTFTTDENLGAGTWVWSGAFNGTTYTNTSEPGFYFLATDGNVYFVPDFGPVTTITSASATSSPTYPPVSFIEGTEFDDDPLDGTANDDEIDGLGGDDSIRGGGGADVSAGFTTTVGAVDVSVTITNDGALTSAQIDSATTQYVEGGEDFGATSALELVGDGGAETVTATLSFASSDDGDTEDAVENVRFRINDIDTGSWIDTLTITGVDAAGDPVTVILTPENTANTVSGDTVTAGVANGAANSQTGSILVEIAGPVSEIDIDYGNDRTGGQRAWITDVSFDTIPLSDGDDTLEGGLGADDLYGGGDDLFALADGDEAYGEAGDDLFVLGSLGEASAAILIDGGETGEVAGDTIDLDGQAALSDVTYDPGNSESGTITLTDGTVVAFSNIENIICFTPGTRIATPFVPRLVETLRAGDLVLPRDNGPRPLLWVGQSTVPADAEFAPVALNMSALPCASGPLLVSPQHRVLFSGYRAELLFGEREVLVAAKHLIDGHTIYRRPLAQVTHIHLMFERHDIIMANDTPTESFFAGDQGPSALDCGARHALLEVFPELRTMPPGPTVRRALRSYEAALL